MTCLLLGSCRGLTLSTVLYCAHLSGDILAAAEGCVLVIDEAYALCSGGKLSGVSDVYGEAVITTLVEQLQPHPGSDIAVIFLGYRAEMTTMFNSCNPGLKRRLQFEQAFDHPDYRLAHVHLVEGSWCCGLTGVVWPFLADDSLLAAHSFCLRHTYRYLRPHPYHVQRR